MADRGKQISDSRHAGHQLAAVERIITRKEKTLNIEKQINALSDEYDMMMTTSSRTPRCILCSHAR